MRRFLACLFLLLAFASAKAQTPTFNSVTLTGPGNVSATGLVSGGSLNISGASTLGGGGTLSGTFGGPSVFSNFQGTVTSTAVLPGSGTAGQVTYYPGCANGAQGVAPGTTPSGCLAFVDNTNTFHTIPYTPSTPIGIGGQTVYLGGSTANQGAGSVILTCSGSFVTGNAITTNAQGTCIDGGVPPGGGGGGGGTVGNCAVAGSAAYYAGSGTSITCLTQVNSSVLSRNSSGTLAEVVTLPSGLTLPTATLSNPNSTGTMTASAITLTGKLTTAATAVGAAGLNLPPGTAPSSPNNGDIWVTSAAGFIRANSVTGGIATTTNGGALSGTAPVAISAAGAISCTTCATTTNGGALSATSPMAISAGGAISLGEIKKVISYLWNATTTVTNDSYVFYWSGTGHINSVKYYTAGTSTPSFTVQVQVNGVNVTGCSAISVTAANTQASPGSTSCTSTAITDGQTLSVSTTSVSGAPSSALVEIIGTGSV